MPSLPCLGTSTFWASAAAGIACASIAVSTAAAQPIPAADRLAGAIVDVHESGRVSIRTEGSTIQALLEALSAACEIDLRIGPEDAARQVAIQLTDVSVGSAIREILRESDANYLMTSRCAPASTMRIRVGAARGPGDSGRSTDADVVRRLEQSNVPQQNAAPRPEPDPRDDVQPAARGELPIGSQGQAGAPGAQADGQVTGAQMLELLTPPAGPRPSVIDLPFPDSSGRPLFEVRPPGEPAFVTLPFPDQDGQPMRVPIGPRPEGFPIPQTPPTPQAPPPPTEVR